MTQHGPESLGATSILRANEAAKSLPGTARIVASSPWCRRVKTLSRRILSLHSSDPDALLFSLQTVDLGEGSHSDDQVKTLRLLKVSLTKADFPDWVGEVLGGERGASFDKFINRCFARLETKGIELDQLLFDFLTDYNFQALEAEGVEAESVLLEHTEREYSTDRYGTDFEVRYDFAVTLEGYSCIKWLDSSSVETGDEDEESGSLQDLLEGKGPSGLVERFQSFYKSLPDRSPLKRLRLLESASVGSSAD